MLPDDSIGYWLSYAQRSFSSAFSEVLRRHCAEQGKSYVITPAQWGILSFLVHAQEQTIGALAQRLGLDAPAITNIVQRLEQSDLVERVRDREDQRIVKVLLSEEGQKIVHSLLPVFEAFNEQLLPGQERQAFIEELQRFVARASTLVPESAGRFSLLRERLAHRSSEERPGKAGIWRKYEHRSSDSNESKVALSCADYRWRRWRSVPGTGIEEIGNQCCGL